MALSFLSGSGSASNAKYFDIRYVGAGGFLASAVAFRQLDADSILE